MSESDTGDVKASQEISKLYIEMWFLKETQNILMDIIKDQGKAITVILAHLKEKKGK